MRIDGGGLSFADTLITLQRLQSLAFGFGTFVYTKDHCHPTIASLEVGYPAFRPLDGLLKDNPPPLQTKHKDSFIAGVSSASDVNPAWMDDGLELGMMKVRWDASLAGRRIILMYILSRKARQNTQMRVPEQTVGRPKKNKRGIFNKPIIS